MNLREEAWQAARRFVIARDRGTCQRCGAPGSDVAHLLPRQHAGVRYEERNLVLLCRRCHAELDGSPYERGLWVGEKFGPLRLAELYALDAEMARRRDKVDLEAVIRGYGERDLTPAELKRYRSGAWLRDRSQ